MNPKPRIALFPGTFDPISNGHLDVIRRAEALFDHLVVAIGQNPAKRELFTVEERLEMVRRLVGECCPNAVVETYRGLTVDYAKKIGATVILRTGRRIPGVRPVAGVVAPITVVRMAVGDAYNAREWREGAGDEEVAYRTTSISRRHCRVVAEFAFRHARQIKSGLKLSDKYFSPRVRNFYESLN
jgi:cytidyltransferase-like protein